MPYTHTTLYWLFFFQLMANFIYFQNEILVFQLEFDFIYQPFSRSIQWQFSLSYEKKPKDMLWFYSTVRGKHSQIYLTPSQTLCVGTKSGKSWKYSGLHWFNHVCYIWFCYKWSFLFSHLNCFSFFMSGPFKATYTVHFFSVLNL